MTSCGADAARRCLRPKIRRRVQAYRRSQTGESVMVTAALGEDPEAVVPQMAEPRQWQGILCLREEVLSLSEVG